MTAFVVDYASLIRPMEILIWAAALLLLTAQLCAAPAHPPLFPEGEPVDDPERVIADIDHASSFTAVAFSPDGRWLASASLDNTVRLWDAATGEALRTLAGHGDTVTSVAFSPDGGVLASASSDNTVRLWDAANGRLQSILFGGRHGLWTSCRIPDNRCWRYDDGTLLRVRDKHGNLVPMPIPKPAELSRVEIVWQKAPDDPVPSPGDGETHPITLRVKNHGPSDAFLLRIGQEPGPRQSVDNPLPTFTFRPPAVIVKLAAGEKRDLAGQVSYAALRNQPSETEGALRLKLVQAHCDSVDLEIPVLGRVPKLALAGKPETTEGVVPTLVVRVRNTGGQDLKEAEFRARISGIDKALARVTEDLIPAGGEVPLSFALPTHIGQSADRLLTLEARELSYPRHTWTFENQPIRLPAPPWQLYTGFIALLLVLSILLWYLRQYTHPLTRRLAADPAALPRLGLEELGKARGLLKRTHRLDTVLSATGIHARWLDQALEFRNGTPEDRVKWVAQRIGAQWQRLEGLGADASIKRFEPILSNDFPLNLQACSVVFPPTDWPEEDVLTGLNQGGDRACLILSRDPQLQAALSRRCRTPDNWWMAPEAGELSALLLSPEPVEAFARLIAGYVKVARISPYQTRAGETKETAFFGRAQLISDIQHREPANYLLVGGRQLGKSSLLLALKRRFEGDERVDCRYTSVGKATIESKLARMLGMPSNATLEAVLDHLGEVEAGKRRVLLLDEADVFIERDAARGYACLNGFRSLSDEGRCHFILAGFWSLYRSASFDYHSPIKNFAETLSIGALEPEACRDLITKPMQALNLRYASDAMVERILHLAGGRANLIAIICDQMLKGLGLAQRELTETDLSRALESRSLRSALEGWGNLTGSESEDRLDRLIVYGLIGQETFTLGEVLDTLKGLGYESAPERVKESLTRLELAFIIGRCQNRFRWQVPLWRDQVLAEEPELMLERELDIYRAGKS